MRSSSSSARLAICLILGLTAGCVAPIEARTPTGTPRVSSLRVTPPSSSTPAPSATSTEPANCRSPGRVVNGTYPGVVLQEPIPYRVYLPPCYDPGFGPYPTLYALHGKPFDDSHWDDLGLDEAAEAGIVAGNWPPFLIVMPYVPEPLLSNTDGGPGSYEQELLEGLIPYIESGYASDPRPASRAVTGISRGGVWALEAGLLHPEVFGSVAALSPALAVNQPRPSIIPDRLRPRTPPAAPGAGETDWPGATNGSRDPGEGGTEVITLIVPGGRPGLGRSSAARGIYPGRRGPTRVFGGSLGKSPDFE
jgi:hypothetical protein